MLLLDLVVVLAERRHLVRLMQLLLLVLLVEMVVLELAGLLR